MYAGNERCVDEGFAGCFGTLLLMGQDGRFWCRLVVGCDSLCSCARPGAGLRTGVCGFGAVVEAEFTGRTSAVSLKETTKIGNVRTLCSFHNGREGSRVGGRRASGSVPQSLQRRRQTWWYSFALPRVREFLRMP